MIKLKLALRNILRSKTYLSLNLIGLSIAFAISFFILSYLIRETSFNKNYENYKRIARPLTIKKQVGWTEPSVSYPLHLKLKNDIPGIEAAAITRSIRSFIIKSGEDNIRVRPAYAVTSDILKIFTPDFIHGDTERFGSDPGSVLLSEGLAEKLFGEIPASGTLIEAEIAGNKLNMTVDGVFRDFPLTSSFRPELLGSFDLMNYEFPAGSYFSGFEDSWFKDIFREYILLEESVNIKSVSDRVSRLVEDQPDELNNEYTLQSMKKMHLYSSGFANDGQRGDIKFVLLFSAVAILILIIAISNYIILSIGSSSKRMPEIATLKIFGAKTSSIRKFLLIESILICLISLPIAFLLITLTRNSVTSLFIINMDLVSKSKFIVFTFIFLLILFTGLISGSYLSAKLGRTSPIFALRRSYSGGGKVLYKILITIQIVIFVSLLSSSYIVLHQINFSKNRDTGFNTDNLVLAEFPYGLITDIQAFKYELLKNPNIESISFGGLLPPTSSSMVSIIKSEDGSHDLRVEGITTDFDFIETAGIEIIEGRDFDPQLASDSLAIIINQTLASKLGATAENFHKLKSIQNVIGIINDIQIHSVREEIGPMTMGISKANYVSSAFIKIRPGTELEVGEYLEETFSEYKPRYINVVSYDEKMKGMYGKELRFGIIVMVFGLIALLVALLGVFGLSLFLSNERRFDTAIYKVFGADVRDVVRKNTLRYLVFVALGNLIAIPLVHILMNQWLQQFAYRTQISPLIYLVAFLLSAIVFIATTFINTIRLANTNPIDNLCQV